MAVYLILLAALYICVFAQDKKMLGTTNKKSKALYIVIFVVLLALAGFRSGIGTDYVNYKEAFKLYADGESPYWYNFEPGFILLIRLFTLLFKDLRIWFFIFSLIPLVFVFKACKNMSVNAIFSIYLYVAMYFYCSSFNLVRQFIAVSIVLFAIDSLIKRKYIKYILLILLASMFHTTALIMLPFALIAGKRTKWHGYVWMLIALGATAVVVPLMLKLVPIILPKYAMYLEFQGGGATANIIIAVATTFLLDLAKRQIRKNGGAHICNERMKNSEVDPERIIAVFEKACILSVCLYALAMTNTLFSRIASYFYIISILSIPYAVYNMEPKSRRLVRIGVCIVTGAVCVYYLMANNSGVVPYTWIFG